MREVENRIYTEEEQQSSLKLFVVLSRALQSVQKKSAQDIKQYGLNQTEFGVLEFLYHKGGQPIQKIGEKVLLASSSITYVVDKLEEKKYLERKACPKDRRVTYAELAPKGVQLMDDIFPDHQQAMAAFFSCLTEEEKQVLIEDLKKVGFHAESL